MADNQVRIIFRAENDTASGLSRVRSTVDRMSQRVRTSFTRSGGQAGRGFAGRFGNAIGGLVGRARETGTRFGSTLTSAAGKAVSRLAANPYVLAGVAALAPILGTAIGAGITLGVGSAMAGGAFALLISQSEKVKSAWSDTLSGLKEEFAVAALPMLPVLERARRMVQRVGSTFADHFSRALSIAAPAVDDFIGRLEGGLRRFADAGVLEAAMTAFSDLLGEIDIESFFSSLGTSFRDLFETISGSKEEIGAFINVLLGGINLAVKGVDLLVKSFKYSGLGLAMKGLSKLFGPVKEDAEGAAAGVDELSGAMVANDMKTTAAQRALKKFLDETSKIANKAISADEAIGQMEAALDKAAEAAKENGRTLNENTEAGRENASSLRGIARDALSMKEAMLTNGDAVGEVDDKMTRAREGFIRTAMQMGMTKKEAKALADEYGLIPDAVETSLKAKDETAPAIESAEEKGKSWQEKVWTGTLKAADKAWEGLSSAWDQAVKWGNSIHTAQADMWNNVWSGLSGAFSAGWDWAGRQFNAAAGMINQAWDGFWSAMQAGWAWAGRVFTATFRVVRDIIPGFASGGVIGAAGGGPRSNTVLVGEQGPELVNLAPGSRVTPAGATRNKLSGMGDGGGAVRLVWGGGPTDPLGRAVWAWLKENVRLEGGDGDGSVQRALG